MSFSIDQFKETAVVYRIFLDVNLIVSAPPAWKVVLLNIVFSHM